MNLDLSDGDRAFRDEVRAFLAEHLQDDWREGQRRTTAMYPEPEVSGPWQRVLNDKGWLVPLWPREWGGTGWTALQRFIFETECALAGAPLVHPMGVRLVGPLLLHSGHRGPEARAPAAHPQRAGLLVPGLLRAWRRL